MYNLSMVRRTKIPLHTPCVYSHSCFLFFPFFPMGELLQVLISIEKPRRNRDIICAATMLQSRCGILLAPNVFIYILFFDINHRGHVSSGHLRMDESCVRGPVSLRTRVMMMTETGLGGWYL
jgi:hypothetical protein